MNEWFKHERNRCAAHLYSLDRHKLAGCCTSVAKGSNACLVSIFKKILIDCCTQSSWRRYVSERSPIADKTFNFFSCNDSNIREAHIYSIQAFILKHKRVIIAAVTLSSGKEWFGRVRLQSNENKQVSRCQLIPCNPVFSQIKVEKIRLVEQVP